MKKSVNKKVAIFAHYDKYNEIKDYVVYYLKELKKVADEIVFVSDSDMRIEQADKISDIVNKVIIKRHFEYDFGSYKYGYIWALENGLLNDCSELIFANDSCFGPMYSFEDVWHKMESKKCDFWGINSNDIDAEFHIQSYFLVFKENVFKSQLFHSFMMGVKREESKEFVVYNYEVGLSQLLMANKFIPAVVYPYRIDRKITPDYYSGNETLFIKKCAIDEDISWFAYFCSLIIIARKGYNYPVELINSYCKKMGYKTNSKDFFAVLKVFRKTIFSIKREGIYIFRKKLCFNFSFLRKIFSKLFSIKYKTKQKITTIFGIKISKQNFPIKQNVDKLNLIFLPSMGLGNRMLGLINAINKYNPKKINIFWDDKTWINDKMSNLFDFSLLKIYETNDLKVASKWGNLGNQITIYVPEHELVTKKSNNIALKYNEIINDDKEEFINIFKHLKPSLRVSRRLRCLDLPPEFFAVQVRNNSDWGEYGRNENLDLFFQEIENKSGKFFLSTMSKEITDIFIERYKDRVFVLPNKNYSSMIDATADLFVISKANEGIYSFGSTFCELAWWISGANQNVKLIGNADDWHLPDKESDANYQFYNVLNI